MTEELQHLKQICLQPKPDSSSVPLGKDFFTIPYLNKKGIFSFLKMAIQVKLNYEDSRVPNSEIFNKFAYFM